GEFLHFVVRKTEVLRLDQVGYISHTKGRGIRSQGAFQKFEKLERRTRSRHIHDVDSRFKFAGNTFLTHNPCDCPGVSVALPNDQGDIGELIVFHQGETFYFLRNCANLRVAIATLEISDLRMSDML